MTLPINDFLSSGAIMSLPNNKLLVGWGKLEHQPASTVDLKNCNFYFSDFFLNKHDPWIHFAHTAEFDSLDFIRLLGSPEELSSCEWTIDHPERFHEAFVNLKELLSKGELEKAVPYTFSKTPTQMNAARLRNSLISGLTLLNPRSGYIYGYWEGDSGILGVTPELLFHHTAQEPQRVKTMALAGTCHPDDSPESFLKNEKERYEHQLVVQGIYQTLKELGDIEIGDLQILKLPRLSHLLTPIEIHLHHSFQFDTLVRSLHPTPALGAVPRLKGRQWLEEFQQHTPRHYYGAPIGFRHPSAGLSSCYVGIRNVQWDSKGMRIGAGCGVIRDSTYEKEWKEIHLKINSIRGMLDL